MPLFIYAQPIVVLLGIFLSSPALVFGYRFFTHFDYASRQLRTLQVLVFSCVSSTLFAAMIAVNEYIARTRYYPMEIQPIEHIHSPERAALNFGVAALGCLVAWILSKQDRSTTTLPHLRSILILAVLATISSALSIYTSRLGFCCETPYTVFAGFPFSLLHGIIGFDYKTYQLFQSLSMFQILSGYKDQIAWYPRLIPLLLDLLFYINAANLLLFPFAYFPHHHRPNPILTSEN